MSLAVAHMIHCSRVPRHAAAQRYRSRTRVHAVVMGAVSAGREKASHQLSSSWGGTAEQSTGGSHGAELCDAGGPADDAASGWGSSSP